MWCGRISFDKNIFFNKLPLCITYFVQFHQNGGVACIDSSKPTREIGVRALGLFLADGAPEWGGGRLFGASAGFFAKTTQLRNEKSKNRSEGAKWTISPRATIGLLTKTRVVMQKNWFSGKNVGCWRKKKELPSWFHPCSGHDREKLCKQKGIFFPNNISLLADFGCFFFGKERTFG